MGKTWLAAHASVLIGLAYVLCATQAWAADAQQSAMAEQLFREGRELLQNGQVATALEKFEASQQLDPSLGTLLNLADCLQKLGRTASAWARFCEAEQTARLEKDQIRERTAAEHARALESKLIRLRVVVDPQNRPADMTVELDGKPLAMALLGTAMPVDPGPHRMVARAPGKRDWSSSLTLTTAGETVVLAIAELVPEPVAASSPVHAAPTPAPKPSPEPHLAVAQTPVRTSTFPRPGLVTTICGAASLVALGLGTGYGIAARSAWDEAKDAGCSHGTCPTANAQSRSESAGRRADVATASFISGGILAGAAVLSYLLLDRPSNNSGGPVDANATWTPSLAGGSLAFAF